MYVLNKRQRIQCGILLFLLFITASLETLGVSIIIPFIMALLSPEQLMSNSYIRMLMDWFSVASYSGILFLTAFLIIAVYILKNGIIIMSNYYQAKLGKDIEMDLSTLMLASYLRRPYTFYLNTNSSEMMRGAYDDMIGISTIIDSFSSFIAESLTCMLIGAMLIYISPFMALGLLLLAVLTGLTVVMSFKKRTTACRGRMREVSAKRLKYIQQPLTGFKEISVLKKEQHFIDQYEETARICSKCTTEYLTINKTPGRIIETVFIAGLLLLVCVSVRSGGNTASYVTQLGTLAFASVRILPSISSIMTYINQLIFNRLALENVYENIKEAREYTDQAESVERSVRINESKGDSPLFGSGGSGELKVEDISWRYDEAKANVLEHLSITIQKGEAVAFIGESGAGKTTLADIILGLLPPQSGSVTYNGINIFSVPGQWAKMVGYVPQEVFLMDDTIRNNVALGIPEGEISDEKVWNALEQAQLSEFVMGMEHNLDTIVGERGIRFSGGQRQRIAIARALYYDPQILVLDEATSALDNDTEAAVMEAIDSLLGKKTLIIVAHRLSTIQNCDKVYEIRNGKAELKVKG